MALEAGVIEAILRGRFDPAGFVRFNGAMRTSGSNAKNFEKALTDSQKRSSTALSTLGNVAKKTVVGGVAVMGLAIGKSVKLAADFESQLSSLKSVSGATGAQMGQLKKQAMDAGAATKYSALDAAQAQTELAKGGLSVAQIMGGGLKSALALAAAGDLDLATAATTTANAMNLFGLRGKDSIQVADGLATAANATTADVGDFSMALTQGGAAAKLAGLDFKQSVTWLEAMAAAGVKGSDAGTSMKAALTQVGKPTKESAALMDQLGLKFFDASGKIKDTASMAGMLQSKLGGMTKEQRLATLSTIAGTDGMRALSALYDTGAAGARRYTAGLSQTGTAARVAAEKQDNFQGKLENFKGSVETAAISIGGKLLPGLTKATVAGTNFLNSLSKTGKLEAIGSGMAGGFETAAHVIANIAGLAASAAGPVIALGKALDLGDPGKITAIVAGIAAFKVASTVAPMVSALGSSVMTFGSLAATAFKGGELKSFVSMLAGAVNPMTAVAVGAGVLAAGIAYLASQESSEEQAARRMAEAKRNQAAAIRDVVAAEQEETSTALGVMRAKLDVKRADEAVTEAKKRGVKASSTEMEGLKLQQRQAKATLAQSIKADKEAAGKTGGSKLKLALSNFSVRQTAGSRLSKAKELVQERQQNFKAQGGQAAVDRGDKQAKIAKETLAGAVKKLAAEQKNYDSVVKATAKGNDDATAAEANRLRLLKGMPEITKKNKVGIGQLGEAIKDLPEKTQTKILTDDQDALHRISGTAKKLAVLGEAEAIPKLLALDKASPGAAKAFAAVMKVDKAKALAILNAKDDATSKVQALKSALASMPASKTVTLRTVKETIEKFKKVSRFAKGRSGAGREDAIVGEGGGHEYVINRRTGEGFKVTGATPMTLGPDDYVIPTEPRYASRGRSLLSQLQRESAGRGLGIMAMAARDLGMPMYAKGRKPNKKAAAGAVAVESLEAKRDELQEQIEHQQDVASNTKSKAKKAAAKAKVSKLRKKLNQVKADLKAAKRFEAEQTKQEELGDIYAGTEDIAQGANDEAAFNEAIKAEKETVDARTKKINKAIDALGGEKKAKKSKRGRELLARLNELKQRSQDLDSAKFEAPEDDARTLKAAQLDTDLTTLDKSMLEAGKVVKNQINVASSIVEKRRELLAFAKEGGDAGEIAQAELDLAQAGQDLNDLKAQQAENEQAMVAALANLTVTLTDNLEAAQTGLAYRQQLYDIAVATGDAGEIAQAANDLASAKDDLAQIKFAMLEITGAQLDTALLAAGDSIAKQLTVAEQMIAYQQSYLALTEEVGTEVEIEQAKQAVEQATQSLVDLREQQAENKVAMGIALASLTASLLDDIDAAKTNLEYQQALYEAAVLTGDEGQISSAADAMKAATDQVASITQQAAVDALERDKALAALTTGIADDKAAAIAIRDYWEQQLEVAKLSGSDAQVADIASKVKAAQQEALSASDAIREQVDKYFSLKREVFSQFGQNFIESGSSGSIGAATTGNTITINNTYLKQPEDPHTWSVNTLYEIEAVSG